MESKIVTTLKEFTKDKSCYYKLKKTESNSSSEVPEGMEITGYVNIFEAPKNPKEAMVAVQEVSFDMFIKTSPVKKILKETKKSLQFKTESGSIYKLEKV